MNCIMLVSSIKTASQRWYGFHFETLMIFEQIWHNSKWSFIFQSRDIGTRALAIEAYEYIYIHIS